MGERTRELAILLIGDTVCFIAAMWVTLAIRYVSWPSSENISIHIGPFLVLSGVWIVLFYLAGLYDKHTKFLKTRLVSRLINAHAVNIVIAFVLFLIIPFGIAPKTNLIIYSLVSSGLLLWWRLKLFPRFTPRVMHRALLIADGHEAHELVEEINHNQRYSYSVVRMVDDYTALNTPDFESKLLRVIEDEGITIIIANPRSKYIEHLLPTLFDLAFLKFEFTFLDFYKVYEDTFDRVPLSSLRYDWFLDNVSQSKSTIYDFSKRTIDIIGSIGLGLGFVLILPLIYIAMRIEGNKKVFMVQNRIGRYNQPVDVYKIQTMTQNDAASATWTPEDAQKGNQITKVGAVLRKLSIDEIPQVWNIFKGEMSLIGPRNDIQGLGHRLAEEIPYYNIRNFVKPGVTGWAQTHQHYMGDNISPQSLEESRVRLAYDLYYVKNRSLLLDISIALRTIKTVLSRFGITIRLPW